MYTGEDWDDLDPVEIEDFTVNFGNDITAPETIASVAEVLLEVMPDGGADASPSNHLFGLPLVTGLKVTQRLQTCIADVHYRLTVVVNTSSGREISRWSHFWCRTPN